MIVKNRLTNKPKLRLIFRLGVVITGIFIIATIAFFLYFMFGKQEKGHAHTSDKMRGFAHYSKISITKKEMLGNILLFNKKLLIKLESEDLRFFQNGGEIFSSFGNDIQFTKADKKTVLKHKIRKYDPDKGCLTVWVILDSLPAEKKMDIYVFYGNKDMVYTNFQYIEKNIYKVKRYRDSTTANAETQQEEETRFTTQHEEKKKSIPD